MNMTAKGPLFCRLSGVAQFASVRYSLPDSDLSRTAEAPQRGEVAHVAVQAIHFASEHFTFVVAACLVVAVVAFEDGVIRVHLCVDKNG